MKTIKEILTEAAKEDGSDIHMVPGNPVMFRVSGELVPADEEIVKAEQTQKLMEQILNEEQKSILEQQGELDTAFTISGFNRIRANIYRQQGCYAMALRILPEKIPAPEEIGLPESVVLMTRKKRGLVLVTGAAGSGKSTTLATLIDVIAKEQGRNIITLEDPIEYIHPCQRSMVSQREIGRDSKSYANALKAALHQDPDVILVGELLDPETISMAVAAAETGHLVFSTLHTNSASSAIDRLIDVFPPYQQVQIRVQLANVMEAIIAQQMLPKLGGGRVKAYEVLLTSPTVTSLIKDSRTHQIPSVMQTSRKSGMQTMDDAILDLYLKSQISSETAIIYAQDPGSMAKKVTLL